MSHGSRDGVEVQDADPSTEHEASADHISEEDMVYQFSVDPNDEWFQRDLTHQPSPVKTMHLSPGVSVKDLYTGESKASDMQQYQGQMSRQEYYKLMGVEIPSPPIPKESPTEVAQERVRELNQVDEIRSQFQDLSMLYPPVRLPVTPRSRPQSAPVVRPRISIPDRKDGVWK